MATPFSQLLPHRRPTDALLTRSTRVIAVSVGVVHVVFRSKDRQLKVANSYLWIGTGSGRTVRMCVKHDVVRLEIPMDYAFLLLYAIITIIVEDRARLHTHAGLGQGSEDLPDEHLWYERFR